MNLYKNLLEALENNQNKLIITRLSGTEGFLESDFERRIVSESKEISDEILKKAAEEVLSSSRPKLIQDGLGQNTFLEPFYPKERLIVLGGGHIALPLVEFAAKVGFLVTVVDDRPSFANKARFPLAEQVLCESFETVFEKLKLTAFDYIVIITRGHRHDTECLRQILRQQETIYVGMIGSKRRVGGVKEMLIEEGFAKERIERICTPIGLAIGAVTPEEISVSIIAQIISRKRLEKSDIFPGNHSDIDFEVIELLAKETKEAYSVVTVIDTKGSVPRGVGAKMLVFPTGKIVGSIGGGCSEAAIIQDAVRIIGSGRYLLKLIDMTGDVAESEGMVCGGIMEVLIEDS